MFSELKQHCILLLDLLQNPNKNGVFLSQLLHFLQRSSRQSLQPFLDYTLFPLLLLFDAAVNCRSSNKSDTRESSLEFNSLQTTHKISDSVAENIIMCLEEVLKKCRLGSVNQMIVILKKLTYGASLSSLETSEEFREGVIRCFKALLLNLCPCSDEYCQCKEIGDLPTLSAGKELKLPIARVPKYESAPDECLLAFLQSEPASAAIGHWISLLLKAADNEATRGQRGSSRLRIEALITVRVLVAKVGTADALAFYLPGVVSQIGKVLHVSRIMISGAAGSTEALYQAIRALGEYLTIVLADDANTSNQNISDFCSSEEKPLGSFLEELRALPVKNHARVMVVQNSTQSMTTSITISSKEKTGVHSDVKARSLRVERNVEWYANTTAHVNKLLSATFPQLCVHPSRKVRLGLLATVEKLLCKCCYTLSESRLMLLECLCVLICDDSEEVSSNARESFELVRSSGGKHQIEHDIGEVFSRLVEKLPQVVLRDEEALAISHARKLLAVTYFCDPQLISDYLLRSQVAAVNFLDVFTLCLSQNSVFAGSLNKLALTRPSSSGFMRSILEIKAITNAGHEESDSSTEKSFAPL